MTEETQDQSTQPSDTLPIDDLNQFVQLLAGWHTERVATIHHLLEVPEGSVFQVGEGEKATEVVLEGLTLAGFQFGLEMALMQLGTLPFAAELEGEPAG